MGGAMKLKPLSERIACLRRRECLVQGCVRPLHGFGFCQECVAEMDKRLVELTKAMQNRESV
jgi:hypothetical protein